MAGWMQPETLDDPGSFLPWESRIARLTPLGSGWVVKVRLSDLRKVAEGPLWMDWVTRQALNVVEPFACGSILSAAVQGTERDERLCVTTFDLSIKRDPVTQYELSTAARTVSELSAAGLSLVRLKAKPEPVPVKPLASGKTRLIELED